MKHSINKIFKNLHIFLMMISILVGSVTLLILEQNNAHAKMNNLINQKNIIQSLTNLDRKNMQLSLILFESKSNQLHHDIKKLHNLNKYDYIGKFIITNNTSYISELNRLSTLTTLFNKNAQSYFVDNIENHKNSANILEASFKDLNDLLSSIIIQSVVDNEVKFHILEKLTLVMFIITLFTTIWYRKRLNAIYQDILYLHNIDKNRDNYNIYTQEVDGIQLRLKRKHITADNQTMLDQETQIYNKKGMLSIYNERKSIKDDNFRAVTVFEIDNFSQNDKAYNQELTKSIVKKIAFTMSLYEQPSDIIARTDYNQFTIISSRTLQDQLFKDVDMLRQSISEIKFKTYDNSSIVVTVSGGFILKPTNQHLDESIRKAKELLLHAQNKSINNISQTKDLAKSNF